MATSGNELLGSRGGAETRRPVMAKTTVAGAKPELISERHKLWPTTTRAPAFRPVDTPRPKCSCVIKCSSPFAPEAGDSLLPPARLLVSGTAPANCNKKPPPLRLLTS